MLASSLMFASAAALLVHRLPSSWRTRTRRSLGRHRRATVLEAVGLARGTEDGLRSVAQTQMVGALSMAALALIVVVSQPSALNVLASAFLVAMGWQAPLMMARAKEKKRRLDVELELIDALGELVMGVEAGLTLEAVMGQYAAHRHTALADEFAFVLDRVSVGVPRSVALDQLRERTPTPWMSMFVSAVQQNQKLGTPLAGVLRQQGETARRRRRQAVEEHAAKLSLKMIFPTVFCILPTLLVVIVGPAIVRLVESLPS
jgi:tight adherence protein C